MLAFHWSVYEVFSLISGLGLICCALLPRIDLKTRASFAAVGVLMIGYGVYVANQTSGTYFFSVYIFILPVLGLGYGVAIVYDLAKDKWPNGISDFMAWINGLGSGSAPTGASSARPVESAAAVADLNLPAPPDPGRHPGPAAAMPAAAPTWVAAAGRTGDAAGLSEERLSVTAPEPEIRNQAEPTPAKSAASRPPSPGSISPVPPRGGRHPGQVFGGDGGAPWWTQHQSGTESPSP